MAITLVLSSNTASQAGGPSIIKPAVSAGQLAVVFCTHKFPVTSDVITPSGWTRLGSYASTGSSANEDEGPTQVTIFYREIDGSEGSNILFDVDPDANINIARMHVFSKTTGTWGLDIAGGSMDALGNPYSASSADSLDVAAGDLVMCCSASTRNAATSGQTLTIAGVTIGTVTEVDDSGNTAGQNMRFIITSHPISSGSANTTVSYGFTILGDTAGAFAAVRIREVVSPPPTSRRVFHL